MTSIGKLCGIAILSLIAIGGMKAQVAAGTASSAPSAEKLVWSDEFNGTAPQSAPDPHNWTYDLGGGGWGNGEYETYCAYASKSTPCDSAAPNAYVGNDGYLHIVARKSGKNSYTSARLKTQGLQSFLYGRIEARIKMPAGQGFWPAFWMLGDNIDAVKWPACGEVDIMESVGKFPATNFGSIHGPGFTGTSITTSYALPNGGKFADAFHTFGILWSPQEMKFYVDDPANVYADYTPASLTAGGIWPFDSSKFFLILNLAVGGSWPGPPDATSIFPQEMLIDYVRVYQESAR
ncbi:beta-glucanase (GH16 family) [Silvibacterium bohemicum]|uniref:Beta-glucanase (GH16 family) n=1 Tax=Silvibacterium bohemicum TaxID=1577686 RepID=A0A841K9Z7_9BACT|nr:glycoside hydrolase family 16 protein [Silvibacterium bohemicum]MBB6147104.1 beta-glucanase (GH16 family) [Silvibacterium bohemicum]